MLNIDKLKFPDSCWTRFHSSESKTTIAKNSQCVQTSFRKSTLERIVASHNFLGLVKIIGTILFVLSFSVDSYATHDRGGTLSWQQAGGNTIKFTLNTSWRRSFYGTPVVGSIITLAGGGTNQFNFGDGSNVTNMLATVTSVDIADDIINTTWTITHTYANAGNYTVFYTNCCRLSSLKEGNNDTDFRLETIVNVGAPYNSPPVSSLPAVINLSVNQTAATFTVPFSDPDGNTVTFRAATTAESGLVKPIPTGFTIAQTGVMTFNTVGLTVGALYAVEIMMLDGRTKVPVDFIIEIVDFSQPPIFVSPTPLPPNNTLSVLPGNNISFTVAARDPDMGQFVTLSPPALPIGSTMSPVLPVSGSINGVVSSMFSWTPTANQVGTYVITFIAADNVGVQRLTSLTINVLCALRTTVSATTPTSCPGLSDGAAAITVQNSSSSANLLFSWTGPNSFAASTQNISNVGAGSYSVRVTDNANGCFIITPVTITNGDITPPTITCPSNQTINLDASCNGTLPDYTSLLTVSDNCTATSSLVITQSPAANTPLSNKGSAIVTFTVKDQSNNSSSCTISVEKKDVTAPTITCPNSITKTNDVGNCSAVATFPQTTATDNCTSVSYTNFTNGEPNQVIGLPEDYIQLYSDGKWNDNYDYSNNNRRSIVEINSITSATFSNYTRIGTFGGHTYYISTINQFWTAAKTSGQSIGGNLASINTPEENQYLAAALSGGTAWVGGYQDLSDPDYAEPGNASQNYGGWKWLDGTRFGAGRVTITQTQGIASNQVFPVGTTTNIFTATDEAGNTSSCSFTVTVTDDEKPEVSCPTDIAVSAAANVCEAQVFFTVSATDNCAFNADITTGLASGSTFPVGTTKNIFTATDGAGYTSTCSFTVTVTDNQAPTFTRPADVTLYKDGSCFANTTITNTGDVTNEADNCSTGIEATYSDMTTASACEGTYTITRTWHLVDANNNAAPDQVQTITVLDNTAPTFTRPADVTLYKDANCAANTTIAITGDVTNEADNCSTGIEATYSDMTTAGACEGTYTITRTWHLVDANNNAASDQVQTITVLDNTAPTFTRPADVTLYKDANCAANTTIAITGDVTNEADNCSTGIQATYSDVTTAGSCEGTYTITRTWYLVDKCGNAASDQVQTITVLDNTAPTFTRPADVTLYKDANCAANTTIAITGDVTNEADNCSTGVQATYSDVTTAGTCQGTYTIKRTWRLVDKCGNTASDQVQTITVLDNTAPTFTRPADVTLYKDANCAANTTIAITGDVTNEADNCSTGIQATYSDVTTAGSCEGTYTITRTWYLVDKCGNAASDQVQTITVLDNTAPTFTRPADVTLNKDATCTVNDTPIGLAGDVTNEQDNCSTGLDATYSDAVVQNCQGTYTITRTWRLVDKCGNAAPPQYQTITVKDNIAPTFTLCPSAKLRGTNLSVCTYTAVGDEFDATATDNCSKKVMMTYELSGVTVSTGNATLAGVVFAKGITTVKWTATDACGNKTTCSFTVTVNDTEKPTFTTCPSSASRNTNPGYCFYSITDNLFDAKPTDNCGVTGLGYVLSGATTGTGTTLAGVKLYVGTTTITWTAADAAGNTQTCSYTVIVNDDQNPTSYIIYATEEAKFGEYNYIGGDVGVSATKGKAEFKKYDILDPFWVIANEIKFDLPSSVNNRRYTPATGGPNPPFYPYSGSTTGLNNIDVTVNGTILNGNYKDVKVKKGIMATINGNNFDKITIEEGAKVTFTATVINMEELTVDKGKKDESITVVKFSNPASVIVKNKVYVKDDADVNVGGPKVTFYVGDNYGGGESFKVNGDNTHVTANIIIPKGKLKVEGGGYPNRPTIMTGWYIIEKLEANGKYTYWNKYDCSIPTSTLSSSSEKVIADIRAHAEYERNVITFVTNQGLKTDYWTAEKLNPTTGNFETLEIRNNVKSTEALQYMTFYDDKPSEGDNFYRIKLTFVKGEVAYSAVEKVNNEKPIDFTVYPNPTDEEAWIDLKSFEGRQITLVLSDILGKTVQQQVIQKATTAAYRINVANLPTGLYLVKVQAQGKRVFMRKLQVVR